MIYAYLKNKNVIYIFKNLKQLKISANYLKNIDNQAKFYNTKEDRKNIVNFCIKNLIHFIDVKIGDKYDKYNFAIPDIEKQYIIKTFIY
jgi:hypothetical protein